MSVPTETAAELDLSSLRVQAYLPFVAGHDGRVFTSDADGTYLTYLPYLRTDIADVNGIPGLASVIYVDIAPPSVDLTRDVYSTTHRLGETIIDLSGAVTDTVLVHRVEVSFDGGPWNEAGHADGVWRYPWRLDEVVDGQTYAVTVRATDVAGRQSQATSSVLVDIDAPQQSDVEPAYVNSAGERKPMQPGDVLPDARQFEISWDLPGGASGPVTYAVGFVPSLVNIDDASLTRYDGPGTHVHPVGPGERWYGVVVVRDAHGNEQMVESGPFVTAAGGSGSVGLRD